MLEAIRELDRLVGPSPQPHAVAIDGDTLYVSSRETKKIDAIARKTWKKVGELDPPGMPWGMTFGGGELVMTCGEPPDDARRIHRYASASGFLPGAIDCPDDTGSHLALYQGRVLLGQWYNRRLLLLDGRGQIERTWEIPHEIAGVAVVEDAAFLVTTDDEDEGEYWLTRTDLRTGVSEDLATIPFHARGLAYDRGRFWTNHRAADHVVSFAL